MGTRTGKDCGAPCPAVANNYVTSSNRSVELQCLTVVVSVLNLFSEIFSVFQVLKGITNKRLEG